MFTVRWLERCIARHAGAEQALFGIVQGSVYPELRRECAEALVKLDLPGYAIGGVSVGEGIELLKQIVSATAPLLPQEKPRYLMGVGLPEDLLEAIERVPLLVPCFEELRPIFSVLPRPTSRDGRRLLRSPRRAARLSPPPRFLSRRLFSRRPIERLSPRPRFLPAAPSS